MKSTNSPRTQRPGPRSYGRQALPIAIACLGIPGSLGCHDGRQGLPGPHLSTVSTRFEAFQLEKAATYGWRDLSDSIAPIAAADRQASAGVLAAAMSAVEAPNGDVHVLDRDYRKIVVFAADGTFKRTILGGFGEGPGEFVRPIAITISSAGVVFVMDNELSRITAFYPPYDSVRAIRFSSNGYAIEAGDSSLLVARSLRGTSARHGLLRIDLNTGEPVDSVFAYPDAVVDFARFGAPGAIGKSAASTKLLYASPFPVQWAELTDTVTLHGRNYHPEAGGYFREFPGGLQVPAALVGVLGIAELADGRIVVYYRERIEAAAAVGESAVTNYYIDVFSPEDRYLGSVYLGNRTNVGRISPTRDGALLAPVRDEDFPVVARLRLVPIEG